MQLKNGVVGLILVLVAFGLCFGYLKYGPRNYILNQTQYPGEAYWSDSDLFVTVQSSGFAHSELKGVKSIPIVGLFVTLFAGNQSASAPAEVAVYHYSGDSVHRDNISGRFVTSVPSGTIMYFVSGQAKQKIVYRWDSLHLASVTGPEADAAIKTAEAQYSEEEDEDAPAKLPEGWHRGYLFAAQSKSLNVPLHNVTATLKAETVTVPGDKRPFSVTQVTITAPTLPAPVPLIDVAKSGMHKISREEFEALLAKDPTPRVQPNPLRLAYYMSEYLVVLLILFSPFLFSMFNLLRLKSKLLANLPEDASFPNALPEQFTALDKTRLQQMTSELEALGFKQLLDYTMVSNMATQIPGFGRLMVNESQNCYAEINQVFPARKKPVPLAPSFMTRFSDGWQLSTGPRQPNGGNWILRLPRSLWVSKPGMDIPSLWQLHQQRCSELRNELGVSIVPARGAEEYFRGVVENMRVRRASVKRKWVPVILFEFYSFSFHKRYEWKGEWPKIVASRNNFAMASAQG